MLKTLSFASLATLMLLAGGCGRHDDELDVVKPPTVSPGTCAIGCRPGFRCSSGECKLDPSSLWSITVTSGKVSERDPASESWDSFGGAPDPYVCFTINGSRICTSARQDTLMPFWNESMGAYTATALLSGVDVEMWDEDLSSNDSICRKGLIAVSEGHLAAGRLAAGCDYGSVEATIAPKLQ